MQYEMTPPVGVLQGLGAAGKVFYVRGQTGTAIVDEDSVASLVMQGWSVAKGAASTGFLLGPKSVTVGNRGNYSSIQSAITALGSRIKRRTGQTTTVAATNGSPTITFGSWPNAARPYPLRVGDLWKPDANSRYYKIKAINATAKTITLCENYADTGIAGVSTAWSTFYLDRISLLILPGDDPSDSAILQPGFDIVSLNPFATNIYETQSPQPYPLTNFGENNIIGLGFYAGESWGDLDAMVGAVNPNMWAGSMNIFDRCYVRNADTNQDHSGGRLAYPVVAGGVTLYRACIMESSRTPVSRVGGAVTPDPTTTTVNFEAGCRFDTIIDSETYTGEIYAGGIALDAYATYNLYTPIVSVPDYVIPSFLGDLAGILIGDPTGIGGNYGKGTVNLFGPMVRAANSGTRNVNGIDVTGAATVNISCADVDAIGTNGTGLHVNNAGATVNVRGGCRFKGSTNSINNVAGTVNKSTSQPPILIGATAGVITAADS